LPDLVFHEAGHLIFSPLGQFMSVVGGSLMQVLIPVVCAIAFIKQEQPFGAAICVWWAGQNLVDLAPYIADARALQMVLLGGRTGAEVEGHDWEYILTRLRIIHLDVTLGRSAHALGMLTMIGSLAFAARTLARKTE
jgi:CBS-domain-containing membrane protein